METLAKKCIETLEKVERARKANFMKNKIDLLEKAENEVYFGNHACLIKNPYGDYHVSITSSDGEARFISLEELKDFSNELLRAIEKIENKDKFSIGESYFFVHPAGDIRRVTRETTFTGFFQDNLLMAMDNIFKTEKEAEAHKEEMLAKFEEAWKKYARS